MRIDVIPRAHGRWFISGEDLALARAAGLHPGEEKVDQFRIRRRAKLAEHAGHPHMTKPFGTHRLCTLGEKQSRREISPDPFSHYPTDPRALPPGVDRVPLITIAHVVNGRPVGGFTWAIREVL